MTLGEKICGERKKRGLSQELLADNSGISLRTIQRIENDKSNPRPYTLKVIADTLGIEMEELLEQQEPSETLINTGTLSKINLINSSALIGVLIPLLNIVAPVVLWKLNNDNTLVNEKGKKVISFQILWFLFSSLILLITHFLHYKIIGEFVTGRVPFVFVIYILLLLLNAFFIIKSSIQLRNKNTEIYPFVPDLF